MFVKCCENNVSLLPFAHLTPQGYVQYIVLELKKRRKKACLIKYFMAEYFYQVTIYNT